MYYVAHNEDDGVDGLGEDKPLFNVGPAKDTGLDFFSFLPSLATSALPGLTKLIPDKAAIEAAKTEKAKVKAARDIERARLEESQRKRQFQTYAIIGGGAILVAGLLLWGAVKGK